jgi:hypothetical protein
MRRWVISRAIRMAIPCRFDPGQADSLSATFELRVRDRPRRPPLCFSLAIEERRCAVHPGAPGTAAAAATIWLSDLIRLVLGRVGWPELMSTGRFELAGDPFLALRLPALFRLPVASRSE